MHGRLKVKTTEEQKKSKLEEKQRKWNTFRQMKDEIMYARMRGDTAEAMLKAVAECVRVAPEWTTLWAYRREILEAGAAEPAAFKQELSLTEACLKENCKAYAVWQHRAWAAEHDPQPDWGHELSLCDKALELDGRNFHCWDYRRFVVQRGSIDPKEELAFSNTKINKDMSDYSSWHYRRSLLSEQDIDMDFELDLVNNAVYTDPNDQSPWFYLRWLLTSHRKETFLREMYINKSLKAVILIVSEAVPCSFMKQFIVKVTHSEGVSSTLSCEADEQINGMVTLNNNKSKSVINGENHENETCFKSLIFTPVVSEVLSSVWLVSLADIDLSKDISVEVRSSIDKSFLWECNLSASSHESLIRVETDIHKMLSDSLNHSVSESVLINQLSVVRDLLDMEPDNKWSLLAVVSLLRVLSPQQAREEILDIFLNRLPIIDPLRTRYYADAASKFSLECHLITLYHSHIRHVSMSSQQLTSLSHLSWMTLMTSIDLSHNLLSSLPDLFSSYLLCLAKLDISWNSIVSLLPLKGLHSLQHLDVSHNLIATFHDLEPVLHCIKLVHLNIKNNLVSQLFNLTELVTNHPTSRLHIGSLSIVYDKNIALHSTQ